MILYYILDTEVTGLSVDVHEINQISVMRVQDQEQLSLQIKVKKPHVYNPGSLQIQGITYKDLKEGRPLEEAVDMIDCFLAEDGKTKAHRCINANGEKIAKAQLAAGVEDMKKDKHGRLKAKFGLNNFMLGVGLYPRAGAHRAEIDVQNTLDLYNWLMKSGTEHVSLISRVPHKETPQHELDLDDF
jgi:DNA polymerase III epsilon subunit-like protein